MLTPQPPNVQIQGDNLQRALESQSSERSPLSEAKRCFSPFDRGILLKTSPVRTSNVIKEANGELAYVAPDWHLYRPVTVGVFIFS